MYYCNARYYSPKWRRFISPDETSYLDAESVNGLNQYCYCNNDPINYTDPSGRFPLLAAIIVAAIAIGCGVHAGFYEGNIYNDIRGQSGSTEKEPLSVWDRINNILIGTTLGLAIGGAVVMLGAMGVAAVVGATTYVVALGGSAINMFAFGALTYNVAGLISMLWTGSDVELIEWEDNKLPY